MSEQSESYTLKKLRAMVEGIKVPGVDKMTRVELCQLLKLGYKPPPFLRTIYTNKKLRAMAKEKEILCYYAMKKEELCEALGIKHKPSTARKTTPVTKRNTVKDETTHFPSLGGLARAMGKNIGSIVWYGKTKRPMPVVEGQSKIIAPGAYIIDRLSVAECAAKTK